MSKKTELTRTPQGEAPQAEERFRVPPVDILETDEQFEIVADMPGVSQSGLSVTVDEGNLEIIGRCEGADRDAARLYAEFEPIAYRRVFTLSPELDAGAIEGRIARGVLRIKLPKAEQARTRKIPIQAGLGRVRQQGRVNVRR